MENLDEYCDVLLILGTCNGPAGTAAREDALRYPGKRHPDANVFRGLKQHLRETGSATPTAHVNAPAINCSCGTCAVKNLMRYGTRIRTNSNEDPQSTS